MERKEWGDADMKCYESQFLDPEFVETLSLRFFRKKNSGHLFSNADATANLNNESVLQESLTQFRPVAVSEDG